jgi:hypothetical protein
MIRSPDAAIDSEIKTLQIFIKRVRLYLNKTTTTLEEDITGITTTMATTTLVAITTTIIEIATTEEEGGVEEGVDIEATFKRGKDNRTVTGDTEEGRRTTTSKRETISNIMINFPVKNPLEGIEAIAHKIITQADSSIPIKTTTAGNTITTIRNTITTIIIGSTIITIIILIIIRPTCKKTSSKLNQLLLKHKLTPQRHYLTYQSSNHTALATKKMIKLPPRGADVGHSPAYIFWAVNLASHIAQSASFGASY